MSVARPHPNSEVRVVGLAWRAAAFLMAPFVPPPAVDAAGQSSGFAALIAAALDDSALPAALQVPIFLVDEAGGRAALCSELPAAAPMNDYRTFADAVASAIAALRAGPERICVVGAADPESADAAWLVLTTAPSPAGCGAYATLRAPELQLGAAHPTGAVSQEVIGWLELPGGRAEQQAAQQCFAVPDAVLSAALRGAARAGTSCAGVRDGLALIRAALALGHKVLPLASSEGNGTREVETGPLPWIQPLPHPGWRTTGTPRQAGWLAVSGDGRPATLLLQEIPAAAPRPAAVPLPQQLFLFGADSIGALGEQLRELRQRIQPALATPQLDLAAFSQQVGRRLPEAAAYRIALVVGSLRELDEQLGAVTAALTSQDPAALQSLHRPGAGRYCGAVSPAPAAAAFLFPGLGASYPYMLADLCVHFPAVREVFDSIDFIAAQLGERAVPSQQVFPPPGTRQDDAISGAAVVTLLMAEWALAELLRELGIRPAVLMGCSTGEFAALCQGGAIDAVAAVPIFYRLSLGVERSLPSDRLAELQSVLVTASAGSLQPLLRGAPDALYVSAELGPDCSLLVGRRAAIDWLRQRLDALGIAAQGLPRGIPYHTPFLQETAVSQAAELGELTIGQPQLPIWSCATARPYATQPETILADASALFVRPIALGETIEGMYRSGVRTFIEVGPGDGLSRRVASILRGRPHVALASNVQKRSGLAQLLHLLAALHALGHRINLAPLFRRCPAGADQPDLQMQGAAAVPAPLSPGEPRDWLTPGTPAIRARPVERIGSVLPALTLDLPCRDRWLCLRIDVAELRAAGLLQDGSLLDSIYAPMERQRCASGPESLLRHVAIKRALQELLRPRLRRRLALSEIELEPAPGGELRAAARLVSLLGSEPAIAVADCAEAAVALVAVPALAARIGLQITRSRSLQVLDAQAALSRALAGDAGQAPTELQVAAVDPATGWVALRAPAHAEVLHARAFRVGSCFITRAVLSAPTTAHRH